MRYLILFILIACVKHKTIERHVIFIDFNGYYLEPFKYQLESAGLSYAQQDSVTVHVRNDFSDFPVTITNDFSVFSNADPERRHEVVITRNVKLSFVKPYTAGWTLRQGSYGSLPSLIFLDNLSPADRLRQAGRTAAHEIGHACGLEHYRGVEGIMGDNWPAPKSGWIAGINVLGLFQEDRQTFLKIFEK